MTKWKNAAEEIPPDGTLCAITSVSDGHGRRMGVYIAKYEKHYNTLNEKDGFVEGFFKTGLYTYHEQYKNVTHWIPLPDLPE